DTTAAEDTAQETFVRLMRAGMPAGSESETRIVMAWLYRTCTRIAIDVLRERKRWSADVAGDERWTCGFDPAAAIEARSTLARSARTTPDDELHVAVLCRVDGLTQTEAAEVLGVSERTVRRLLDRFDDRLQKDIA